MPLVRFLKALLLLLPVGFSLPLHAQLNADFIADVSAGCAPLKVSFTNRTTGVSSGATYRWDLGNGNNAVIANPSAIYTDTKTYNVTLTVSDNGKTSSKTIAVTVHPPPTANFTVSSAKACSPAAVTFTSTAQPGGGSITDYYWDFGDGTTELGSGPTISHTYQEEQEAPVSLTVKNNFGCSHTVVKAGAVKVLPSIAATFTASEEVLCKETDPVHFNNNSVGPGTLSYEWDFGDGAASTEKTPSHAFNKKGIYTVMLTVKSSEGCTAQQVRSNYLNVAQYGSDFNIPALLCTNTDVSITPSFTPTPSSATWEVDGILKPHTITPFNMTFDKDGAHVIKLTAKFGNCTHSTTKNVVVAKTPDLKGFEIEHTTKCGPPATVIFRDTTKDAITWEWDQDYFAGAHVVRGTTREFAPVIPGASSNRAFLKVYTKEGCSASVIQYINVPNQYYPYVNYKNASGRRGELSGCDTLRATYYSPGADKMTEMKWTFSDGTTSTEKEPTHTFKGQGTYTVRLNYTTVDGCQGFAGREPIYVSGRMKTTVSAEKKNICGDENVRFLFASTPDYITNKFIYIDDAYAGSTSYSFYDHRFGTQGTHSIKVITEWGACLDTTSVTNIVSVTPPFAKLEPLTYSCEGDRGKVLITQTSRGANHWEIDFGDGESEVSNTDKSLFTHHYKETGSYRIVLSVTNGSCTSKAYADAYVHKKQAPELKAEHISLCADQTLAYSLSNIERSPSPLVGTNYFIAKWEYGDGSTNPNIDPYGFIYMNPYKSSLQGMDQNQDKIRLILREGTHGCADTTNYVNILFKGAAPKIKVLSNNVCYSQPIILEDVSEVKGGAVIYSRQWDFGDGQQLNTQGREVVEHKYNSPGDYQVTLTTTDSHGCTTSYIATVSVYGPKAQFSLSEGNEVNQNALQYFYNNTQHNGSYDVTYKWYVNDELLTDMYYPEYKFTEDGNYTVRLEAASAATGCSSSYAQQLLVKPFNYAFTFNTTLIGGRNCPPALVRFQNTSVNHTRVEWDFGDGFRLGNTNYPSHIYEKPGKYYVKLYVYGPNGLTGEFKDSIVIGEPAAFISSNSMEGCKDHEVTLTTSSENSAMYLWDFGDGQTGSTTNVEGIHEYSEAGRYTPSVIAIDVNGCMRSSLLDAPIIIRPNPSIAITASRSRLCLGESTTLSATGALTYEWASSDAITSFNTSATIATPGTSGVFSVKGMDDIGCSGTGSISIEVVQPQKVTASPDVEICLGEDAQLKASGTDRITWINDLTGLDDPVSFTPTVRPEVSTRYTVQGTDRYNCFTSEAYVNVTVNPLPSVSAGNDLEVLAGTPHQLNAVTGNGVVSLNWTPGTYLSCNNCPVPIVRPLAEMQYVLTATTAAGCISRDTVLVKLQCESDRIRIPNGFTPNGDGHNDHFLIKGIGIIKHMVVYSRWGDKVFERSNFIASEPANAWNGYIKGLPAPAGTYVYFIELQCPGGQPFTKKGTVTLMR